MRPLLLFILLFATSTLASQTATKSMTKSMRHFLRKLRYAPVGMEEANYAFLKSAKPFGTLIAAASRGDFEPTSDEQTALIILHKRTRKMLYGKFSNYRDERGDEKDDILGGIDNVIYVVTQMIHPKFSKRRNALPEFKQLCGNASSRVNDVFDYLQTKYRKNCPFITDISVRKYVKMLQIIGELEQKLGQSVVTSYRYENAKRDLLSKFSKHHDPNRIISELEKGPTISDSRSFSDYFKDFLELFSNYKEPQETVDGSIGREQSAVIDAVSEYFKEISGVVNASNDYCTLTDTLFSQTFRNGEMEEAVRRFHLRLLQTELMMVSCWNVTTPGGSAEDLDRFVDHIRDTADKLLRHVRKWGEKAQKVGSWNVSIQRANERIGYYSDAEDKFNITALDVQISFSSRGPYSNSYQVFVTENLPEDEWHVESIDSGLYYGILNHTGMHIHVFKHTDYLNRYKGKRWFNEARRAIHDTIIANSGLPARELIKELQKKHAIVRDDHFKNAILLKKCSTLSSNQTLPSNHTLPFGITRWPPPEAFFISLDSDENCSIRLQLLL